MSNNLQFSVVAPHMECQKVGLWGQSVDSVGSAAFASKREVDSRMNGFPLADLVCGVSEDRGFVIP
jgi:hypothetical protein